MKNIVTKYKGNHSFSVVEKETVQPGRGDVRIKVAYVGVCGTDVHIFHGMMDKRINIPETIGHEMSGIIDAIGDGVLGFEIGEKVVVRPLDDRGAKPSDKGYNHICEDLKFMGIDSPGAMQQYWNVPVFTVHKLKVETDLKLAALTEPLSVAVHDVRLSELKSDETAVVLGGGPIGLLVAMVAQEVGANVIVSEINKDRIMKATDLGLTVINPHEIDLVDYTKEQTDGRMADVVFEVTGVQSALDIMTELAGIRGRIVMVAIHGPKKKIDLFKFFWKELSMMGVRVYERDDYERAIALITANKLPFEKLISEVKPLTAIQSVFEGIDANPTGLKVLMDCSL